jgi:molecular chaperone HtpG
MFKLKKSDFGGDILSILTKGVYTDPRDALREYIQNGVDAGAKNISIKIRQNSIVIDDDGRGMDYGIMRKAIRLGISDKNPKKHVGFMGIGIYSSFHICDRLTIYSRVDNETPNVIYFDFKGMREFLEQQRDARLNNGIDDDKIIDLQTLLEEHIEFNKINEEEYPRTGTTVEMTGVDPGFFKSLSKFDEVSDYLEQTVPLPFNPNFKWGKLIEKKIDDICEKHKAHFELINLTLQINEAFSTLYRPYDNQHFDPEPLRPYFMELKNSSEFFGVAWGCLNSSRNTIKNNLRGFLIKKQGFAIGHRDDLLKYFKRQTFFNRYIGEVIVVHPQLLPNAPRTDFEFSPLRINFEESLREVAGKFNEKANFYQETSKSEEAINEAIDYVKEKSAQLNFFMDNIETLAEIFSKLTDYINSLKERNDNGFVKENRQDDFKIVTLQLKRLKEEVRELIQAKRKKSPRTPKTDENIDKNLKKIPEKTASPAEQVYKSLLDVVVSLGIDTSEDLKEILQLIDERYIQTTKSDEEYTTRLKRLKEEIEERLKEE